MVRYCHETGEDNEYGWREKGEGIGKKQTVRESERLLCLVCLVVFKADNNNAHARTDDLKYI